MSEAAGPFLRHLAACNNTTLPGGRAPLLLDGFRQPLGWIDAAIAGALPRHGLPADPAGAFRIADVASLARLGRVLADAGLFRTRNEAFDVRMTPRGPSLGTIDRGALPAFGLIAAGVHVNGIVERPRGATLWIGRRAADKALDPDKLDHLVAGGIPAGYDAAAALRKEGEEECSLPAALAANAVPVGHITYAMQRPEGLRRDLLDCFDLVLPADFQPVPNDDEVAEFRLLPLAEVVALVRDTDEFKFNVNLVLIDLFLRRGLIDSASADGKALRDGLRSPL
ncbi:NUDIX domain-containing protein [Lichenicoccus sp.]|uniref:NUDIX hydrolase n=1 Tax=Lichenicoccus sp. TaxID=2781899 RepID=UPI003D09D5DE